MWFKRITTLILILTSAVALAESDISGSTDSKALDRFRGSYIVEYDRQAAIDYLLPLGSIEKVNGAERPEKSERLSGKLTRITYRIPEGHRTREIYEFFSEQLAAQRAETLFSCRGRECGSSAYWANQIFDRSKLYGVERSQYYHVASLPGLTVVMYIIERGNLRLYAHLDLIETDAAARIVTTLSQVGYVDLAVDTLPSGDVLQQLKSRLASFNRSAVVVVHHQGENLAEAQEKSEATANELRALLNDNGLGHIAVKALGALAPSVLGNSQLKVVLVAGSDKP